MSIKNEEKTIGILLMISLLMIMSISAISVADTNDTLLEEVSNTNISLAEEVDDANISESSFALEQMSMILHLEVKVPATL